MLWKKQVSWVTFTLAISLSASGAVAQEGRYQCTQGGLVRQVMIVYEIPGEAVPCQVIYSKPSEGAEDQVLWSAVNESGYCEFKAREFRQQLTAAGWDCSDGGDEQQDTERLGDETDPPEPPVVLDVVD